MVRGANISDADAIAQVHVASWRGAYRGLLPDEYLASLRVDRRAQMWRQNVSDPTIDVFVASDAAARVVGFASMQPSRDEDATERTGELTAIYVMPDAWGAGFGRRLLEAAVARAKDRGFTCMTLWVLASNDRARQFYERAGLTNDGTEKTDTRSDGIVLHQIRYRLNVE